MQVIMKILQHYFHVSHLQKTEFFGANYALKLREVAFLMPLPLTLILIHFVTMRTLQHLSVSQTHLRFL